MKLSDFRLNKVQGNPSVHPVHPVHPLYSLNHQQSTGFSQNKLKFLIKILNNLVLKMYPVNII